MARDKPRTYGKITAEIRLKILSIDETGVIIAYETKGSSGAIHDPNNPNKGIRVGDEVTITHDMDIAE